MAEATARIAGAVSVPVTADVEAGYGDSAQAVAETVRVVISAGAVLEDSADSEPPERTSSPGKGNVSPLLELEEQLERVRAVVEAGRTAGVPLVVNARTDVYWRGSVIPTSGLGRRSGGPTRFWRPAPTASSCLVSRTRASSATSSTRLRAP